MTGSGFGGPDRGQGLQCRISHMFATLVLSHRVISTDLLHFALSCLKYGLLVTRLAKARDAPFYALNWNHPNEPSST